MAAFTAQKMGYVGPRSNEVAGSGVVGEFRISGGMEEGIFFSLYRLLGNQCPIFRLDVGQVKFAPGTQLMFVVFWR